MNRHELLQEVDKIINSDREKQYGTPENNFQLIAEYWSIFLQTPITAQDVGVLMALLKIARIQSGQVKADNFIDLAGYALCAGDIALKRKEEE